MKSTVGEFRLEARVGIRGESVCNQMGRYRDEKEEREDEDGPDGT